jgi:hypothetical protein
MQAAALQCPERTGFCRSSIENLDWVTLAAGMGSEASRAMSVKEFAVQSEIAMKKRGPRLIDAVV